MPPCLKSPQSGWILFPFRFFCFFFAGFIVSCAQDMVKQLQPAVLAFCEARKQHSMIQFRGIQRFRSFFGKWNLQETKKLSSVALSLVVNAQICNNDAFTFQGNLFMKRNNLNTLASSIFKRPSFQKKCQDGWSAMIRRKQTFRPTSCATWNHFIVSKLEAFFFVFQFFRVSFIIFLFCNFETSPTSPFRKQLTNWLWILGGLWGSAAAASLSRYRSHWAWSLWKFLVAGGDGNEENEGLLQQFAWFIDIYVIIYIYIYT